ncbi:hypothetical protein FHW12_002171 [Dokdonella fugitiva]|uniref:Outer membrane repeat protein n=1 Tax=Dokdonella fugitiva TaxID=328517 RepID=A0A839ETX1_9GAMM|nr:right-handed parallel beta-helix repeat-containing protein [Dokdonella fugitiva]MBA8887947.1 hypothetical protein [Dokdonella fugitiva]
MCSMRTLKALVVSSIFILVASTAHAQTRTWVSGVGDDVNPCSRTAPCKTFAGAISKTAAGGIINVLDPGGFGAVTITKAITIEGPEKWGGILNTLVNGVIVNAGASDTVVLRGLSIDGAGSGTNGVRFLAGGKLVIEDCYIAGSATGVDFEPSGNSKLEMLDTTVNNTTANAVLVQAGASGNASASMERIKLTNGAFGLKVGKGVVSVKGAIVSNMSTTAVKATASTAVAQITLVDALVSDNGGGVNAAGALGKVFLSDSTITNNTVGVSNATGGAVTSFGNNNIAGNATDGSPSSTIVQH